MILTDMLQPNIIHTTQHIKEYVTAWHKTGLRVGLVPTMGSLHAGHLSLIHNISQHVDRIIVSIFVNPTQFSQNEDYSNYPRNIEDDIKQLTHTATSIVYAPNEKHIYPSHFSTQITLKGVGLGLEADIRENLFAGVTVIVMKLFMQCQADVAIFGEKDYQQLLVIRRLVEDLDISTEILSSPIIREADGLAMSSRNVYLNDQQRQIAKTLPLKLQQLCQQCRQSKHYKYYEEQTIRSLIESGFTHIDYLTIRDADTLLFPSEKTHNLRALAAVRIGNIRLIDNMVV